MRKQQDTNLSIFKSTSFKAGDESRAVLVKKIFRNIFDSYDFYSKMMAATTKTQSKMPVSSFFPFQNQVNAKRISNERSAHCSSECGIYSRAVPFQVNTTVTHQRCQVWHITRQVFELHLSH